MAKRVALTIGVICLAIILAPWGYALADMALAPSGALAMPHKPFEPVEPDAPSTATPPMPRGYTGLPNPAWNQYVAGTPDDPLAAFGHRPMDTFIIPEGGLYLDPLHDGPHFGVDYANPEDYLNGRETYFRAIGPGYVTARASCVMCFVDGDIRGRVNWKWPQYNFGWGVLVVVESPVTVDVSIYVMYAHLARDFVSLGDYVTPEDIIGVVGSTGYSETYHLHVEVRYGPPGRFWNADFTQWDTMERWLGTLFVHPALLIYPEYHDSFVRQLNDWVLHRPFPPHIP